jgi:NADH/F420H2 dehydrogenase subunit C
MLIKKIFPYIVYQNFYSEESYTLLKEHLLFVIYSLKHHYRTQYTLLVSIAGVDFLGEKYRFGIVYELLSIKYNTRIRLKVYLNDVSSLFSITSIFVNANWWEREIWDMFGIFFKKHPGLRRILTDYGFEGFPLRKDFPLSGYIELRYDTFKKKIIAEPLELSQEYRLFSYESQW